MAKALLTIVYRQVLDATSAGDFARNILHYSYEEFKLKSQVYNAEGKFNSFTEMKANDGRANSLHYKSGFAIGGLVETLQKKIPGITDILGKQLIFETHQFELIESALNNKLLHQAAIHYFTPVLRLYEIIGDNLLLSYTGKENTIPAETFLLKLQPSLSIANYQELTLSNNLPGINTVVETQ